MSQINDALRRASDAAKGTGEYARPPAPPPLSDPDSDFEAPLPITGEMLVPPLIPQAPPRRRSSAIPIIGIVLLVFCAGGAAGFRYWKRSHRSWGSSFASDMEKKLALMEKAMAQANSNATANVASTSNSPAAATSSVATPKTTNVAAVVPKPAPAVQPRPVAPAVVANSTPAKFPPLRLQSIFYRPPNPSVMINGKLLCVSDEIQGVLVADIQPSSVTLVLSGYTNVLTLR